MISAALRRKQQAVGLSRLSALSNPFAQRWILGLSGMAIALGVCSAAAIAQTTQPETTAALPPEQAILEQLLEVPSLYDSDIGFNDEIVVSWPVVGQEDASLYEPTMPSLWWSRDQLPSRWRTGGNAILRIEGYRLIRDWISFASTTADTYIIDVQVDPQYWNRLNYFHRYAILNQLGTTGMSYGYQVRIYSSLSLIGVHACDFSTVPELADTPQTNVPVPDLSDLSCAAAVGPFVDYTDPAYGDDLFAPP